jgi:hypothetical protein
MGCPAFPGLRISHPFTPRAVNSGTRCGPHAVPDSQAWNKFRLDYRTIQCSAQYPPPLAFIWSQLTKNGSASALPQHAPVRPNKCRNPSSSNFLIYSSDVNIQPWREYNIWDAKLPSILNSPTSLLTYTSLIPHYQAGPIPPFSGHPARSSLPICSQSSIGQFSSLIKSTDGAGVDSIIAAAFRRTALLST